MFSIRSKRIDEINFIQVDDMALCQDKFGCAHAHPFLLRCFPKHVPFTFIDMRVRFLLLKLFQLPMLP